jgi:DNA-directed RNA polymerase specialized sigma24 family protein
MPPAPDHADLLDDLRSGRREALDRITALVCDELREIAHRDRMARKEDGTLAATARALLQVDEALGRLEQVDGRLARVVEYRFFGGMTNEEIAGSLGVTVRTVERDWVKARTLLRDDLKS